MGANRQHKQEKYVTYSYSEGFSISRLDVRDHSDWAEGFVPVVLGKEDRMTPVGPLAATVATLTDLLQQLGGALPVSAGLAFSRSGH